MGINSRMDKYPVIDSHNGIPFCSGNERAIAILITGTNSHQKLMQSKRSHIRGKFVLYDFLHIKFESDQFCASPKVGDWKGHMEDCFGDKR